MGRKERISRLLALVDMPNYYPIDAQILALYFITYEAN
jgi:hypothetical protein